MGPTEVSLLGAVGGPTLLAVVLVFFRYLDRKDRRNGSVPGCVWVGKDRDDFRDLMSRSDNYHHYHQKALIQIAEHLDTHQKDETSILSDIRSCLQEIARKDG